MQSQGTRLLYWTPRVLTILFALFISLFALDVFADGKSLWQTTVDLMMHLLPTLAIILVLIVAWHREWLGAVVYFALAVVYVVWAWGRFPLATYLIIAGPLVLVGFLFMLNWQHRGQPHGSPEGKA